jgi:hypothetical protein
MAHISEVSLYLNNLPSGDSTEVIVGPVMALAVQPAEIKSPVLTVNGQNLALPVTLKSGDFLEIDFTGSCTHYDDKGDLVARIRPDASPGWPMLKTGGNAISLDCARPEGVSARAEVTLVASGPAFGTPNSRARIDWKRLTREYDMPRWITAADDVGNTWDLPVRPGEKAWLEIEFGGGMDTPVLTVNGSKLRFPVTLKRGQRLVCRDSRHWTVIDEKHSKVADGELAAASPVLKSGSNRISFSCTTPDRAIVKLVKVYEP